jgi:peptidoglycan/xylan/chitin deacetylase (PgdA/CDA1 family)
MKVWKNWAKNVYEAAQASLPLQAGKAIAGLEFKIASVPRVHHDKTVHPGDGLARGAVTFSIDFELSWGWQYAKVQTEGFLAKGLREREQVPEIIAQLDAHHIPATWATVGHLFLSGCPRGGHGLAHPDLPRLRPFETRNWKFAGGDWYQFDPCSNVKSHPSWYAPDLIEKILSSRAKHEVACHSFSHAGFGAYCPREVALAELDACKTAMASLGLEPTTWVFPGDDEGNFPVLAEKGILVVRCFPKAAVNISLPLRRGDGIWGVPVSSAIERGKYWTIDQRLARLQRFVDVAAATKLAAHIWFHPSLPRSDMQAVLFPLLAYCANQRDKGLVDILTMEQLVAATDTAGAS